MKGYGVDQVRYFFLREAAFGQDGTYSHEAIVNRINADLANDLGNLAQRSLSMIAQELRRQAAGARSLQRTRTRPSWPLPTALYAKAREAMDRQGIKLYLDAVWAVVADANRYFAGEEPWAKRKTDPARMGTILYVTAEVVRQVAILAAPVVPAAAGKLLDGAGAGRRVRASFRRSGRGWPAASRHADPAADRGVPALRRAGGASRSRRRRTEEAEAAERRDDIPSPRTTGRGLG